MDKRFTYFLHMSCLDIRVLTAARATEQLICCGTQFSEMCLFFQLVLSDHALRCTILAMAQKGRIIRPNYLFFKLQFSIIRSAAAILGTFPRIILEN